MLEGEYEYDPTQDEIGEDGAILAGAAAPQTRAARERLRYRQDRRADILPFDVKSA